MRRRRVLIGCCLVLREHEGENLALMVTGDDGWMLPGGHVDGPDFQGSRTDEWAAAKVAAARELEEETGLCALKLARLFIAESDVRIPALVHVFHVSRVGGHALLNAEPGTHARWFPWLGWPPGPLDGFYRQHFPHGVARLSPAVFVS